MLFRRYEFGWQLVDIALGRISKYEVRSFGVSAPVSRALLAHGAALPETIDNCWSKTPTASFAVSQDEEAVRAIMQRTVRREAIKAIAIVGNFESTTNTAMFLSLRFAA